MSRNQVRVNVPRDEAELEVLRRRMIQAGPSNPARTAPPRPRPPTNNNNTTAGAAAANQFGNVRDRLFHAMLIRLALKYNERFSFRVRRVIELLMLLTALLLMAILLFVHLSFSRSSSTCLRGIKTDKMREGITRVEVVRNLDTLKREESFVAAYVDKASKKVCTFDPKHVFLYGPKVMPAELRAKLPYTEVIKKKLENTYRELLFGVDGTESEEPFIYPIHEELEAEAQRVFLDQNNIEKKQMYEYLYRVEYAWLYGVLRLPPTYRAKYGIPTEWIRIDADSECFGNSMTRFLLRTFLGYEDTIVASLREQANNITADTLDQVNSMGYLHDLRTHEHFHFIANMLSKTSYLTAAILMLTFTFAISMLLRFSHQQIFIFIIDLLNMFEQQQPLHFPVAPILTVILALVGMEAIMSEVFNDTTTAFYVILIVWMADQYDAIFCYSQISKRYWLRFFYMYQFFFYAYQYRFGSQYGTLALLASASFIAHSMIYFFHHYEMPMILHQDRMNQVASEVHTVPNMGPIEIQTVTVAVRPSGREVDLAQAGRDPNAELLVMDIRPDSLRPNTTQGQAESTPQPTQAPQPTSPSSVFDARGPLRRDLDEPPTEMAPPPPVEPSNPEEIVAHAVVDQVLDELFNTENPENTE